MMPGTPAGWRHNCDTTLRAALDEIGRVVFTDAPIPHHVHMTARSGTLSTEAQANITHIRQQNPDWQFTLHDDEGIEAFLCQHYGPATLAVYRRINPRYGAARADMFRYLCMHKLGGIYLDIKSTTSAPLAAWLTPQDRFILSQWDNGPQGRYADWGLHADIAHIPGGEYQQWFIAAAAGHPFLRAACERVVRNVMAYGALPARFGRMGVLRVTGPIAFSLAIHPILPQHPHRFVDVEGEGWLAYSFYPRDDDHIARLGGVHYSRLTEPIVQMSTLRHCLFALVRHMQLQAQQAQQHLQHRVLKPLAALRRRWRTKTPHTGSG